MAVSRTIEIVELTALELAHALEGNAISFFTWFIHLNDGKVLAATTSHLKIFSCLDDKKLKKFPGHPSKQHRSGRCSCMVFSKEGRHVLSFVVGDRHVAVWKLDGSEKKSAHCLLAMDHPAVFLDYYNIKS